MTVARQAVRLGGRRIVRKLARSIPWLGAALAVAGIGAVIRRKGVIRGTLDSALDATPFVGGMKNACEIVRGRDFIRDKTPRPG